MNRSKVNIGAASLVLIFIVLCLGAFGLLSLSSAQGDLKLAGRAAQSVAQYYEADSKGQQWVRSMDAVLREEMRPDRDSGSSSDAVKSRLGEVYHQDTGLLVADIPMDQGQALHIELALVCGAARYQVRSWYVYDSAEFEIDNSMPVWGGEAGGGV